MFLFEVVIYDQTFFTNHNPQSIKKFVFSIKIYFMNEKIASSSSRDRRANFRSLFFSGYTRIKIIVKFPILYEWHAFYDYMFLVVAHLGCYVTCVGVMWSTDVWYVGSICGTAKKTRQQRNETHLKISLNLMFSRYIHGISSLSKFVIKIKLKKGK